MGNVGCEMGFNMVEWGRVGKGASMGISCCHMLLVKVWLSLEKIRGRFGHDEG